MKNKKALVKKYLDEKYQPEIAFLYGSFATNTSTSFSDIDCICFAKIKEFIHDSSVIDGNVLDCWIYPIKRIKDIEIMLHIIPCEVLIDKKNVSAKIIKKIIKRREEKTVEMTGEEKNQLIGWINKMINRCYEDTIESNYRYNWLLYDFPELYCKFRKEYYDGPIKTLKRIKKNNEIYSKYEIVMKQKNIEVLKKLYDEVIKDFI